MSEREQHPDAETGAEELGGGARAVPNETEAQIYTSSGGTGGRPIEDLFEFDEDPVDFMSAESFPASDPPPPP